MSHSTLIQCEVDLQQKFQATKEGRSFEHLCSTVHVGSQIEERGLDL
jgi:hypothetical protein